MIQTCEHSVEVNDGGSVPAADIGVKDRGGAEHPRHIIHLCIQIISSPYQSESVCHHIKENMSAGTNEV